MESSSTGPLDLRLPAPDSGPLRSALAALPIGAALVVAPLVAISTQDLAGTDRLNALMLVLAGAVILGWGVFSLTRPRPRLQHPTDVTLDGVGVTVHGTDLAAMLTWPDVAVVEVGWWEIVPPYVDEAEHLPVLRFVARHDGDIRTVGAPGLSADLAHSFGLTVPAAALTVVVGGNGIDELQQVLGWVVRNRPDVAVELEEAPGH
ncbi:MAG TPA: hypothetical protein VM575_14340 [Nocardioides sp.]|nr:hypothetical protein [Nocardioides sp.]